MKRPRDSPIVSLNPPQTASPIVPRFSILIARIHRAAIRKRGVLHFRLKRAAAKGLINDHPRCVLSFLCTGGQASVDRERRGGLNEQRNVRCHFAGRAAVNREKGSGVVRCPLASQNGKNSLRPTGAAMLKAFDRRLSIKREPPAWLPLHAPAERRRARARPSDRPKNRGRGTSSSRHAQ